MPHQRYEQIQRKRKRSSVCSQPQNNPYSLHKNATTFKNSQTKKKKTEETNKNKPGPLVHKGGFMHTWSLLSIHGVEPDVTAIQWLNKWLGPRK